MKKTTTRIGASVAAIALATGAALATAAPASAATTVGDVTWYTAADFGTENVPTPGYPSTPWFWGDVAVAGDALWTAEGLYASVAAGEAVQILSPNVTTPADATAFASLVRSAAVYANGPDWNFQLPLFTEGTTGFTTLRLATNGVQPSDATAQWKTSQAFGTYAAGDEDTLENFAAQIYAGTAPQLLGYGAIVGGTGAGASEVSIAAIEWDGSVSAFTPVVTRTITPNPVTPAEATSTGIRLQGSGWIPGSEVYISIYSCEDEEPLYVDASGVAGADGTVDVTVVLPTAPAVGTYCVFFDDDGLFFGSGAMERLELTVANVLPATGLEITAPIVGGIAFLVIGGLALVVTRKVERTRA